MMRGRVRRVPIALVIVGLFVAVSQMQTLRAAFSSWRNVEHPDEVTRHEDRFQALKQVVPRHGVVGYVSDPDPVAMSDPASWQARQAFKRYLIAQYALVPVVVLRSLEADLVVGDFSGSDGRGRAAPPGFVMAKDFGDGVVLFRRGPR